MADTRIIIENRVGKKSNTSKTSTKGTKNQVKSVKKSNEVNIGQDRKMKDLNKTLNLGNTLLSNVGKGRGALSLTKAIGGNVTLAAIHKGLQFISKGIDIHYNVEEAKSGNSLFYSNQRQVKNLVMSGGLDLIYGSIRNELVNKKEVARQNLSLDYGKQLYNLNNYGEKYKTR